MIRRTFYSTYARSWDFWKETLSVQNVHRVRAYCWSTYCQWIKTRIGNTFHTRLHWYCLNKKHQFDDEGQLQITFFCHHLASTYCWSSINFDNTFFPVAKHITLVIFCYRIMVLNVVEIRMIRWNDRKFKLGVQTVVSKSK